MWDKTQRAYHVTNIRNQPKENTVYTVAPKINYINLRRKHYKSQREQKHIPSGLVHGITFILGSIQYYPFLQYLQINPLNDLALDSFYLFISFVLKS